MIRSLIFILLIANSVRAHEIMWHRGSVVMSDQSVLVGEIAIQSRNLVLVKNNHLVSVFPAHKIQLIRYYDSAINVNRKFMTLKDSELAFQRVCLYEAVVSGKLEVVRRQRTVSKKYAASDVYDFDYFIIVNDDLIPLQNFKQKLYTQLVADSPALQHYIKEQKLDPRSPADAIQMVMFYNQSHSLFLQAVSMK